MISWEGSVARSLPFALASAWLVKMRKKRNER